MDARVPIAVEARSPARPALPLQLPHAPKGLLVGSITPPEPVPGRVTPATCRPGRLAARGKRFAPTESTSARRAARAALLQAFVRKVPPPGTTAVNPRIRAASREIGTLTVRGERRVEAVDSPHRHRTRISPSAPPSRPAEGRGPRGQLPTSSAQPPARSLRALPPTTPASVELVSIPASSRRGVALIQKASLAIAELCAPAPEVRPAPIRSFRPVLPTPAVASVDVEPRPQRLVLRGVAGRCSFLCASCR